MEQLEKEFFRQLATLSQLRHLELELGYHGSSAPQFDYMITKLSAPPISELTALTHMAMRAPTLPRIASNFLFEVLLKASKLNILELHTRELSERRAAQFAESFGNTTRLQSVSITGSGMMEAAGAKEVSEALEGLKRLTRLDLTGAFSEVKAFKFFINIALPTLQNLKQLILEGGSLREVSVRDISVALSVLTGIEDLQVQPPHFLAQLSQGEAFCAYYAWVLSSENMQPSLHTQRSPRMSWAMVALLRCG
jgi:hypothetical protein